MQQDALGRCPTFVVDSGAQRETLESLVRRKDHLEEDYQKNKPLCFNAASFQKPHPRKGCNGQMDADATLCSPMLVAVADGVSQIEEYGIDASELPNELLNAVEKLAASQLLPGQAAESYAGPINMMHDAWDSTESMGSTTVLAAMIDNSTKIHGKLHPMIAVCSIGDCEIVIMRGSGIENRRGIVFHTEMQRLNGNIQCPLQLARVDETVDPQFDPDVANEVIEQGSAVHCISAIEGDIVVAGSDGVFDNLFIEEIVQICDEMMPHRTLDMFKFEPIETKVLQDTARRIVLESHLKTQPCNGKYPRTPIGVGGKIDDTCCVVAQVVEWTEAHSEAYAKARSQRVWRERFACCDGIQDEYPEGDTEVYKTSLPIGSCGSARESGRRGDCSIQ